MRMTYNSFSFACEH